MPSATLDVILRDPSNEGVVPEQDLTRRPVTPAEIHVQENPISNLAVRRDPVYGDELAALKNYNHIDVPNP